jgi:hypothetical protein
VATVHGGVCHEGGPQLLTLWGGASLTANNRKEANYIFHDDNESLAVCLPMRTYMEMLEQRFRSLNQSGDKVRRIVDYFSMDVEGNELDIILSHDWVRWPVFVVSIEVAVQPLLSGTAEYQHQKRCALFERGLCRWPFYDLYTPPVPSNDSSYQPETHFSLNNEIWVNPALLPERP